LSFNIRRIILKVPPGYEKMVIQFRPQEIVARPVNAGFRLGQSVLDKLLSPVPPGPHAHLVRPKIAIIGAGITGVTAAAHCVGHGFDVVIFEAGTRENLGGIWTVRICLSHQPGNRRRN